MAAERRVVYRLDYRTESVQKGTKKVDSALKKTDTQFKKSGKPVKDLTNRYEKFSDAQAKAGKKLTTTGKRAQAAAGNFNTLGSSIGNTNSLLMKFGVGFSAAIIVRGLKDAIVVAAEFLEKVSDIYTLSAFKEAPEFIGTFEKELRAIRLRVPFMELNTLTEATYKYISATGDAAGAMEITEKVAMTAAGNQAEAAVVMDVLNKSYANFGFTAEDSTDILDKFSVAIDNADAMGSDLAENFGRMAASADALNWSIDETFAAFAIGTRALKPEEVATGFSAIYSAAIINADAFREWGIATDDLGTMLESIKAAGMTEEEMAELFPNVRAIKLINVMLKQMEEYEKVLGEVENASGRFSEKFQTKMESNAAAVAEVGVAWDELKLKIGIAAGGIIMDIREINEEMEGMVLGPGAVDIDNWNEQRDAAREAHGTLMVIDGKLKKLELSDPKAFKGATGLFDSMVEAGKAPGPTWIKPEWITEVKEAAGLRVEEPKPPPTGAGAPAAREREKTPEEEIADAIRVVDQEYARRKAREEWLLDTTEQGRETRIESEYKSKADKEKELQDRRLDNAKAAGDLAGDTFIAAITGGDVLSALRSVFLDQLGSFVSMAISGAMGGEGFGPGGFLKAIPIFGMFFEKGGVFDPIHAQRGQIFKPRPGGYNVVLGEPSTGGEAVTPFNNYGKELLRNYVIPKHFPELMSPAAYTGVGGGGMQSVNVEPAAVTVVVDGIDPRSLRAKQTVDRGSRAKAAVAG